MQILKQPILCLLGISFLLCLVLFSKFLGFEALYLFTDIGSDTINAFYPQLVHTANYLRSEGIPKWSFNHGMGQNIMPAGTDNPINHIFYWLGADRLAYALAYVECLKILLASLCFFLYLRMMQIEDWVAVIGGLLLGFCGYIIVGGSWYGHSTTVLYTVFLLLAFEYLYQRNIYWLLPIAVFLLGGTSWYFSLVFMSIYTVVRLWSDEVLELKRWMVLFIKVGVLGLVGVALSGPAVMSIINRILNSPRGMGGTVSNISSLANAPILGLENGKHYLTVLMRFFHNDLLGNGDAFKGWGNYLEAPLFYCGLISLLLVPQFFCKVDRRRKIAYGCVLGFWALLVIFPYFRYAFYLFAGDYYKSALSLFIPLSLLLMAMWALHEVMKDRKVHLPTLGISGGILLLILWLAPYLFAYTSIVDTNLQWVVSIFLLLYSIILAGLAHPQWGNFCRWILLVLVVLELGLFNYSTINNRMSISTKKWESRLGYNDYTKEAVEFLRQTDESFYRIEKDYHSGLAKHKSLNDAKVQTYHGTSSYASFNQRYYVRFLQEMGVIRQGKEDQTRWIRGLKKYAALQSLNSVKYHLTKKDAKVSSKLRPAKIGQYGDIEVYRNKYVQPFGFAYKQFMNTKDFEKVPKKNRGLAILKAALIDADLPSNAVLDTFPKLGKKSWKNYYQIEEALKIKEGGYGQNFIKGTIKVSDLSVLYFSIPYDKGWQLWVNGETAPLHLVNIGFMGTILQQAGEYTIELRYQPPFYWLGWACFVLALVALIGLMLIGFRK